MADAVKVLKVLRAARTLIEDPRDWCSSGWGLEGGPRCALHALRAAEGIEGACFVSGAVYWALSNVVDTDIGCFNDSHTHAEVIAAFDKAIATLEAELEPTPNADAALEVMDACDKAGAIVARQIVAEHPEMNLGEITALAGAELFYAAQDTARVCSVVDRGFKRLTEIIDRAT